MGRTILINIVRFVLLIFIQAFLLKNIGFYNLSIPFPYILFIMLLPFEVPNWLLFLLAMGTGLTVDAFYDTAGLNAAACAVLAFVRIVFINVTVERQGFENEPEPKLGIMGFRWFFIYTVVLTLFHHVTLIFLEAFGFFDVKDILTRVFFSSIFTIFLIVISEFIFFRKKER
ncbi:rod shape-determining protein MreD [Arcticibacter eurypsychrophilus]|uniref:rod shape-determining protein MreD n=1 Tax=Arcticibacter eurypsychrophilus TaxID=1434752 RepID=UPI00084D14F4|nr:rod shape-determining protein MreD [Arcticibacter eurypsychrophilus]